MDSNRKSQMFDRYGNPIDEDVVPDGGFIRVPMMLRDSAPAGGLIFDAARQRRDAALLADLRDKAARVAAYRDHYAEEIADREAAKRADPVSAAYHDMIADMNRGRAGGAA